MRPSPDPTPAEIKPARWSWLRPSPTPSHRRRVFEFVAAVILPLVCLALDPLLFKGAGACTQPYFGNLTIFMYVATGLAVATFTLWLIFGRQLPQAADVAAGLHFAAALVAFGLGLLLLPFSLLGLLAFGLGAIGFIPFLTAGAYWQAGLRARAQALEHTPPPAPAWRNGLTIAALVISLSLPAVAQWFNPPAAVRLPQYCYQND